uniref:ANK_REP_REGION domain-containing protein n=1 Tax=Macrostomum lignano TaxID=282301 RepID=A0A1I8G0G7_9PLAT
MPDNGSDSSSLLEAGIMQTVWDLRAGYEDTLASPLFPVFISVGFYFATVFPMTFFDLCASRWAWYRSYKLQPEKEITWPMVKKCLALVMTNNFLYVLPVTVAQYIWVPPTPLPAKAPTALEFFGQLTALLVIFDFQYGVWHAVHHKNRWLYKNFHSTHHQYHTSFALVGQYLHPWELFTIGLLTTVDPWFFRCHPMTCWVWMLMNVWLAVEAHSGLDIWFSLSTFVPFGLYGGSRKHDMHHMKPLTNFQPYLSTWDRFFDWDCPGMKGGGVKPEELLAWEQRNKRKRMSKHATELMTGTKKVRRVNRRRKTQVFESPSFLCEKNCMRQRQLIDWFNNMESTTFRELFPVHELTEEISGFFGYIKTRLPRHSLFAAQQQLNVPSGANDKAALAALQAKERKEAELLLRMQRAAEEKDMAALSGLFSPANVDRPVKDAMRLSDLAAALGSTPMLQLVLDHGGQINAKNAAGQLPIHYALTSPEVPATVAYLLERGADPNIPMPNGDFLMHKACSDSATTLLDLLLNHQADPGCLDSQRHTPLHRACINDLREHAEIDAFGRTALHIAVENQNIQLMKMLLEQGATIDRETENGMTAIDSMMVTKNRGALKELIVYFTEKVSKDVRAYKMTDLYRSKHFRQFLNVLKLIDSEACKCYYRAREEDLEQKRETELKLVNDLLDVDEENTQDVMDFQSKMMAALKTGAIHDCTDNREIIDTIAIFTTKYILFREDVSMLQDVMHCGVIWRHVSQFLEEHIATLYSKTNKDASIISKLFAEQFIDYSAGGKRAALRRTALVKKVGDVLGMYQLSRVNVAHCLEVTNPIDTLPIWSILTGKMNLTLEFLSQVQFEAVPVCLMAAGLLRNLHKVLNVDTLELPSIAVLADQCEIFACKVVERMCMVDVSEHKKTTYQYLLQILPAFDNLNCLHLAANCGCDTFLRLDTCQKAMDVAWYRFLLDVNPIYREIIIALGCIPLNPLVSIALYRDYRRLAHAEQERRLSLDAVQSADQTEGSGSGGGGGGGGGSSRNRRTSFMIEDDDTRDATSTMFSDALEFQPPDPRLHGGTMAAKVSECCTLYYYFYQIPAVKFRYFTISHLVLLCTLSYVVQFQLNASITALE